MLKMTPALLADWLATNDIAALLDTGFIYYYSGPVPADASVAVDPTSTKTAKISLSAGGTGLTWDATNKSSGYLQKAATDTWSGSVLASKTVTFARWCMGADDGSAAATGTTYRLQWTLGLQTDTPAPDFTMNDTALVSGNTTSIDTLKFDLSGLL